MAYFEKDNHFFLPVNIMTVTVTSLLKTLKVIGDCINLLCYSEYAAAFDCSSMLANISGIL